MKIEKNRYYADNSGGRYRVIATDGNRVITRTEADGKSGFNLFESKTFLALMTQIVEARPSQGDVFMEMAHLVSDRGTCSRRRVGAVAAIDGRVITTGYNGAPEGCGHCHHEAYPDGVGDPDLVLINGRLSCVRAVHAEANVLAYAARYGVSMKGSTIYTNTYPCVNCARAMISAGVREVQYDSDYFNDPHVLALSRESGLMLTPFSGSYYKGG